MPPKSAAKKKASAPTVEIIVTLEGVVGSTETSTLPEDTPLKQVRAGGVGVRGTPITSLSSAASSPIPPPLPHRPDPTGLDEAPQAGPCPLAPRRGR